MLEQSETQKLVKLAQNGDMEAKEIIVRENTPLLKSIIKRYRNRGVEYDDLFQLASIGFLKAIKNFDASYNVKFSTYAVPMIIGEIKRHMRDDGYIKVSRALKILSGKINRFVDAYVKKNNNTPSIKEIAAEFGIEETEVVFAMDSNKVPVSLYEKTDSQNEKSLNLLDKLSLKSTSDDIEDKITLKEIINNLSERERKIIILRYFKDLTQSEVAKELCVSQVQISRLETKILEKIKENFCKKGF